MIELTEKKLDILREIVNIASGNAATALSELLQKRIDMGVPIVEVKQFQDVADRIGEADEIVTATLVNIVGKLSGNILFIIKEDEAKSMACSLLDNIADDYDENMIMSVFKEIGNILGNSYLRAIGTFLGIDVSSSIPYISTDMLFSIMSTAYINTNGDDDYVIDIGCTLSENNTKFNMNIFFVIDSNSLAMLLEETEHMLGQ